MMVSGCDSAKSLKDESIKRGPSEIEAGRNLYDAYGCRTCHSEYRENSPHGWSSIVDFSLPIDDTYHDPSKLSEKYEGSQPAPIVFGSNSADEFVQLNAYLRWVQENDSTNISK